MTKVIGVKFPHTLKIYDFLPGKHQVKVRDFVVVETTQGIEVGQAVYVDKNIGKEENEEPLKEIMRIATSDDLKKTRELEDAARDLNAVFSERIKKYNLPMSSVGVGYSLDGLKAIFYFTAEGRVDFRELSKDLSRSIQKQAILRQIGPRDEAKLVGGYGRCGREICCATFLIGTEGVSMDKIEKQYGGPKSTSKISGICGRLMCCLNYEMEGKKQKEIKSA